MVTIEFQPTPSQNTMKKWHWSKYSAFRDGLCWYIRQHLVSMKVAAKWTSIQPGTRRGDPDNLNLWAAPPCMSRVEIIRHSPGTLDYGNHVGGCKPLLDALVIEGLLWDDAPRWLADFYHQETCKKGESKTIVEVSW